jgi:hypothetical protein
MNKKIRLSRGVAVGRYFIDDISAFLRATDLRFRLTFVSWAGLMHLIQNYLKSLLEFLEHIFKKCALLI